MSHPVSWKGCSFWQQLNSPGGRFDKIQVLSRRNSFAQQIGEPGVEVPGDIIPIPNITLEEINSYSGTDDVVLPGTLGTRTAFKTVEELIALGPCTPPPASTRSPLDQRIAELEASIALDRASRMAASPRMIADLRPEPLLRSSSLLNARGINRLPRETTRRIINLLDTRADICALSRVSKSWREETIPVLYSTVVLRGWDEVVVCLRSICSNVSLAGLVNDLTIDSPYVPESLHSMFYATLENGLDVTRNLRRLVLNLCNDKKNAHSVACVLGKCRFRLHHFVYNGPEATGEFLDLQRSIRTLQISHAQMSLDVRYPPASLPPDITQLWISISHDTYSPDLSQGMGHASHVSYRGDSAIPLRLFTRLNIHYLALDISTLLLSGSNHLPPLFSSVFRGSFSGLRILRLVGYCVICETSGPPPPAPMQPLEFVPLFGEANLAPPQISVPAELHYGIGRHLSAADPNNLITSPNLIIERGLLTMLSNLPNLQALEVGSFVVRDSGVKRSLPGYGRHWLAQRVRWEEEFIHRITTQAARQLVAVSFLAYDEPLYYSCFTFPVSPRRWYDHIEAMKKRVIQDEISSGITLPELIIQAGVTRLPEYPDELGKKCDYRLNSAHPHLTSSRLLVEEVVTNEWVKAGPGDSWIKRVNVRNLRDIWPVGC